MNASGIYLIICHQKRRCYVGKSEDMGLRRQQHLADLRNKRHHNELLQADYDELGEAEFVFAIDRLGAPESLLMLEAAAMNRMSMLGVALYNAVIPDMTKMGAKYELDYNMVSALNKMAQSKGKSEIEVLKEAIIEKAERDMPWLVEKRAITDWLFY